MITAIRKEITEIKKLITVIKFALIFTFAFIFIFLNANCYTLNAEEVTITTYYPAPEGVYDELRSTKMAIGPAYYNVSAIPANTSLIIEKSVGIGTPNPDSTALLDLTSTTQGLLLPRMNTAQRNLIGSGPPAGLMIYNNDSGANRVEYYNGTTWTAGGDTFWAANGNDIYNTNYNTGNVGIGTSTPNATLQINGSISRQGTTLNGTAAEKLTQVNLGINSTTDKSYSNINGGYQNSTVYGNYAAVIGYSNIGGGYNNVTTTDYNTIGGGSTNKSGNVFPGSCVVGGGQSNKAYNTYSAVIGGYNNQANGYCGTIAGGSGNYALSTSTVGGGYNNQSIGTMAIIVGGSTNITSNNSQYSTIIGGYNNQTTNAYSPSISGGGNNQATGSYSSVPGGDSNKAAGSYSFAAGRQAKANHQGSFVWADSTGADYNSNGVNSFNIRANGGVWFGSTQKWDIAEFMDVLTLDKVEEKELVSLVGNDTLGKSKRPYDDNLIGVISSKKTTSLNLKSESKPKPGTTSMPVSLVGRCYLKVSNEQGPIKIGDPVTSSSTAGFGMKAAKAGKIVGYAMEKADFRDKSTSEILVFVNSGYYMPKNTYEELKQDNQELQEEIDSLNKMLLSLKAKNDYSD